MLAIGLPIHYAAERLLLLEGPASHRVRFSRSRGLRQMLRVRKRSAETDRAEVGGNGRTRRGGLDQARLPAQLRDDHGSAVQDAIGDLQGVRVGHGPGVDLFLERSERGLTVSAGYPARR
ncbi:MAG: hypothetical protein WDN72_08600 [Alphaproteobacteria bacterium]